MPQKHLVVISTILRSALLKRTQQRRSFTWWQCGSLHIQLEAAAGHSPWENIFLSSRTLTFRGSPHMSIPRRFFKRTVVSEANKRIESICVGNLSSHFGDYLHSACACLYFRRHTAHQTCACLKFKLWIASAEAPEASVRTCACLYFRRHTAHQTCACLNCQCRSPRSIGAEDCRYWETKTGNLHVCCAAEAPLPDE